MTFLSDRGYKSTARGLSYTFEGTAAQLDTALIAGIAHNLGALPSALELWAEVSAGKWEQHDPSTYVLSSSTQLEDTGTTVVSGIGAVNVKLIAHAGAVALSIPEAGVSQAGIVGTGPQTFGGVKTFASDPTFTSGSQLVTGGAQTIAGAKTFSSNISASINSQFPQLAIRSSSVASTLNSFILGNNTNSNAFAIVHREATTATHFVPTPSDLTNGTTTANEAALTILDTGNVGIGTASPLSLSARAPVLHLKSSSSTLPGLVFESGHSTFLGTFEIQIAASGANSTSFNLASSTANPLLTVTQAGAVTLGPSGDINIGGVHTLNTGTSGANVAVGSVNPGTFTFGNLSSTLALPCMLSRTTDTTAAMYLIAAGNDANTTGDMVFNARESDNTAFATTTNKAFSWQHFTTEIGSATRAGAWTWGPNGFAGRHIINTLTTTSATAGVSGALPAQVAGYIEISINGNNRKIPYYL